MDTHEREKRHQQTDRWTDIFGHTRRAGQTTADSETDGQRETDTHVGEDRHRQWTEGGRYDAPFKSFGQQGQLCQLCPFLAHDSLMQVVQQRVQLTDTDITARAHVEGQVGEVDDHSALPGHWGVGRKEKESVQLCPSTAGTIWNGSELLFFSIYNELLVSSNSHPPVTSNASTCTASEGSE